MKCEACRAFYRFFATTLLNTIIQEYECYHFWRENVRVLAYIRDVVKGVIYNITQKYVN